MDAFPAFYPLAGRRIVIAGDGPAAEAKLRLFAGSPAEVVRIGDDRAFAAESYAGAVLAFIATGDDAFAGKAAAAARSAGVPVNVADRPALCDFTTPAVIDRGEVVAAIGTGGASPMLATLLRHDLETRIPAGAGHVAALFRLLQDEVRTALPDLPARRAFLRQALTGPAAEAALGGDMAKAARSMREDLAGFRARKGFVLYIDARGPADLLTLRDARLIAAADVICADAGADPAIVSLARRDAERMTDAAPQQLAELARAGLAVVRLAAADWQAEMAAVAALDVPVARA